jgi:hypothetical protein
VGERERPTWPRNAFTVGDVWAAMAKASRSGYRARRAHTRAGERRGLGEEGGSSCQVGVRGYGHGLAQVNRSDRWKETDLRFFRKSISDNIEVEGK